MLLELMREEFNIHRLDPGAPVPPLDPGAAFFSVTSTADEISVVCPAGIAVDSARVERGWSALKIAGVVDFSSTGVMAQISGVLADEGISIFTVSTFDTDYILVNGLNRDRAVKALKAAGYRFAG